MDNLKEKNDESFVNDLIKSQENETRIKKFLKKIKSFFYVIKTRFIAEYAIFQRLRFFFNKKNKEFQIESIMIYQKKFFVKKYGYEKGLKKYQLLCSKLSDAYFLNKRIREKFD